MPVFPLVGSMITVSLVDDTRFFGFVDHADADSVFYASGRIVRLELCDDRRDCSVQSLCSDEPWVSDP